MQTDLVGKFIPGKVRIKYGGAVVGDKERKAIQKVLDRNWWVIDEEARLFEKELAEYSCVKHALFVNSGSSALLLAISVLDLPKGSEIIIPAVNFPTVVNAALVAGLKPVFVDVNPGTYCIDLSQIQKAKSAKTKAVVCVNIAGSSPDLKALRKITKENGLHLILDNCDGYGSFFAGKPVESFADTAATSFHAAHIITTGEGGAMFTSNDGWHKKAVSMREWGRAMDSDMASGNQFENLPEDYPSRYTYITRGFNFKPIELQAAMGRVQLKRINSIKKARKQNFQRLHKGLSNFSKWLKLPETEIGADISWFSFPLTLQNGVKRKEMLEFLESKNIETRVIFAGNIIYQPAYREIEHRRHGSLKNADVILRDSFFISVHPTVTKEMVDYMVASFGDFFSVK